MSESTLTQIKTALIATLISAPLSILIGFYVGKVLQAPHLSAQYVRVEFPFAIEEEVLNPVKGDEDLMREFTQRNSLCAGEAAKNEIHSACLDEMSNEIQFAIAVLDQQKETVARNLKEVERWTPGSKLTLLPIFSPGLLVESPEQIVQRDKPALLNIYRGLQQKLDLRRAAVAALRERLNEHVSGRRRLRRTGSGLFSVGVLNSGESDGVIFPGSSIDFLGSSVALQDLGGADYKVIGAHSFREMRFKVDEAKSRLGDFKSWNAAIDRYAQDEFIVKVPVENGTISCKGALPNI